MRKKIFGFGLLVFAILCVMLSANLSVNAAVSTMSQSDYDSKVNSFINDGRWKNGISWSPGQGPKLSSWSSSGCFAYTADFVKYMFGRETAQYGNEFTNAAEIRAGDVVYADGTPHYIVVLSRSGNKLRTAEGNWGGKVRISDSAYYISGSKVLCNNWSGFYYNKAYHQVTIKANNPPTATLSINKVRINPNDSVTFTLGGKNVNGTFTLGIYRDNQRIETFTTGYNHTYTCTQPGNYSAYMTSYNDAGLADSNWVYWTVGQISAVLSVDKNNYSIHDNVIFSFTANNTINKFTLGIYKDGERIKTVDVEGDTYLYNILENGYYTAYMTAYNDSGLLDSNWVEWEVGSLNFQPQYTMIYNNHLYSVYDVNLSWKTAEKFCKEKGGHLATITTVEENNIIKELVKYGAKKYYMLGASDEKSKGVWEWVTGENFSYVDWYNGEPNNAGGVEHYLDIYSGLGWNDDCNYKLSSRGFILEIENQQSLSPFTTIKHDTYAEVINNTSKSQSATVIIAKYSNKKLKDTKIISTTFSANEEKSFSHSYGSDYKVFVWDSLEGMKPLAE